MPLDRSTTLRGFGQVEAEAAGHISYTAVKAGKCCHGSPLASPLPPQATQLNIDQVKRFSPFKCSLFSYRTLTKEGMPIHFIQL